MATAPKTIGRGGAGNFRSPTDQRPAETPDTPDTRTVNPQLSSIRSGRGGGGEYQSLLLYPLHLRTRRGEISRSGSDGRRSAQIGSEGGGVWRARRSGELEGREGGGGGEAEGGGGGEEEGA
ncbi:hypothetical protein GMDG_02088 [Pseudogymnoascus destructans 20631-21]|uniref:Uncharacterized protein n=1 Tax=Pseudogymnoascus destructans (strain ATCC MYA-4855 / 20631-21) TaxID=658429 RepID=L8G2Z9_PSED2|nr:hypothetical protein GMDG_02088 [Pseudogymnoascus destructans 20631-21]